MRVLVVDDDAYLVRGIMELLTRQTYVVDTAANGQEAWEYVQTCHYDLIILDVMLPGLDGRSLCEKFRQGGVSTPILLLTVRQSSQDKVAGLNAGADDYMVKPFDWDELLARIRALCRRESALSPLILTWSALHLNPQTCQVTYAGELVSLGRQEYRLLELFLRYPTKVFSCSSILEQLWTLANDPPLEATVRAHIKSLRRKLKASGATDVISTVYGLGYRLQESPANLPPDTLPTSQDATEGLTLEYDAEQLQEFRQDLTTLWSEIQPEILNQVGVLEAAIQNIQTNTIAPSLYKQAIAYAHKLAGTVGAYGFKQGSQIARQIETLLLEGDRDSDASWSIALQEQVLALRQVLSGSLIFNSSRSETDGDRDYLTQLLNRVKFTQDLDQLLRQAKQHHVPVALCIVDIKNLKAVNHQYGYAAGDRLLQNLAAQLLCQCSANDLVARWSGRKFAIALCNQTKSQAKQFLNAIEDLKRGKPPPSIRIAIGQFPDDGQDAEALYRAVEQ